MKIKTILLGVMVLALACAVGMYASRDKRSTRLTPSPPISQSADSLPAAPATPSTERAVSSAETPAAAVGTTQAAPGSLNVDGAARKVPATGIFDQALGILVSREATFQQKQSAWGQLRDAGKLDWLIGELETQSSAHPETPQYQATLGQAYLQKAGTISDLREQGILGMKADQSFETALNADPSNWEARFWKATAMSYWPPQLGKGKEVIENFLELLKQQEVLPPQPQFAQTYVALGDEYQKQGHAEYAEQIWKRGMGLFPEDNTLKQKLSGGR